MNNEVDDAGHGHGHGHGYGASGLKTITGKRATRGNSPPSPVTRGLSLINDLDLVEDSDFEGHVLSNSDDHDNKHLAANDLAKLKAQELVGIPRLREIVFLLFIPSASARLSATAKQLHVIKCKA